MKKKFFSIALLISFVAFGQKNNKEIFDKELGLFVDSITVNFNKEAAPYLVFVARLQCNSKNNFCFTLGYILNSGFLNFMAVNYVYYFKNQPVVLIADSNVRLYSKFKEEVKKYDEKEKKKIVSKLFPSEDGGYSYVSEGLVYYKKKEIIQKKFYSNSDEIPIEKSIYGLFPLGIQATKIEGAKQR